MNCYANNVMNAAQSLSAYDAASILVVSAVSAACGTIQRSWDVNAMVQSPAIRRR